MQLHLGLEFDNLVYAPLQTKRTDVLFAGVKRLLQWLEIRIGLAGYSENTDYLRIELYRQALLQWRETAPEQPFYAHSFEADRMATAAALLSRRDELMLAGWDFNADNKSPERLLTLAGVERIFRLKVSQPDIGAAATGFADRCQQTLEWLRLRPAIVEQIFLHDPEDLYPPFIRQALAVFRAQNIPINQLPLQPGAAPDTDLGWFQQRLADIRQGKLIAKNDGSLLVLTARRDSDAAVFLAQWLARNPEWRPVFLLPELNRTLEQALVLEGFPAMGVLSASLARPSLQVLKLAPAFLWEPVDVFKIMEFVTLPLKPLDDGLALEIARVMAEKPGLYSDTWFAAVLGYLETKASAQARDQYEFWFDRRRYKADATVPKRDAVELYAYLHRWALEVLDETGNTNMLVLAEQARRVRDLLETLPEPRLNFLELERIVRTIYEPAPVQLTVAETGHFEFVHHPGALAALPDSLVWWNCLFDGTVPAPDQWRAAERAWLDVRKVKLDDPMLEGRRKLFLSLRPVLQTTERLVLVVPEQANGAEVLPSLLLSDLEAAFEQRNRFTFCLDNPGDCAALERIASVPPTTLLENRPRTRPRPQLVFTNPERLNDSEYETPTNLESLFYYPHRWFFRQKMRLFPASLLSVKSDQTLLGSLAHRFFELLLQEDCLSWSKSEVAAWMDNKAGSLLEREGATLLLYGREPERNQFLNRIKNAAWSLLSMLRNNGWTIESTELPLEGAFAGLPVRGKADLVLRRNTDEQAIVDLKWSGAQRRKEMIQNGEDLQLILYAHLLPPKEAWPHTAYFILENGKMIARNKAAFQDAVVAGSDLNHVEVCADIFARMERTFSWRMAQLRAGRLELRTARTAPELDAIYAEEMLDLLEMKLEDARWDDYRTLLEFMEG